MAFNPFEHAVEMVATNISGATLLGLPVQDTVPLPDGHWVQAAVLGHPETITYWLKDAGASVYHQITQDQQFAQVLWLHFAYGMEIGPNQDPFLSALGLAQSYHIADAALKIAVLGMPDLLGRIVSAGISEQQVYDYAHAAAPDIMLIGQSAI